jgi:hypothetical protein
MATLTELLPEFVGKLAVHAQRVMESGHDSSLFTNHVIREPVPANRNLPRIRVAGQAKLGL